MAQSEKVVLLMHTVTILRQPVLNVLVVVKCFFWSHLTLSTDYFNTFTCFDVSSTNQILYRHYSRYLASCSINNKKQKQKNRKICLNWVKGSFIASGCQIWNNVSSNSSCGVKHLIHLSKFTICDPGWPPQQQSCLPVTVLFGWIGYNCFLSFSTPSRVHLVCSVLSVCLSHFHALDWF